MNRYCPKCKRELMNTEVYPDAYLCEKCGIIFRKDKTLTKEQSECNCEEFEFVCKKHGKNCKGDVQGIVEDINNGEIILLKYRGLIKSVCKKCGRDNKFKWIIEFSEKDKSDIKSFIDEKDLIEDSDMENLKKLKIESGKSNVVFGQLFLTCFDYFNGNIYAFYDKENKELQKKLRNYLTSFKIDEFRKIIREYGDGNELGSHYKEMDINEFIVKNRGKMEGLILLFFECFESE